jgi:hypothetical protein
MVGRAALRAGWRGKQHAAPVDSRAVAGLGRGPWSTHPRPVTGLAGTVACFVCWCRYSRAHCPRTPDMRARALSPAPRWSWNSWHTPSVRPSVPSVIIRLTQCLLLTYVHTWKEHASLTTPDPPVPQIDGANAPKIPFEMYPHASLIGMANHTPAGYIWGHSTPLQGGYWMVGAQRYAPVFLAGIVNGQR